MCTFAIIGSRISLLLLWIISLRLAISHHPSKFSPCPIAMDPLMVGLFQRMFRNNLPHAYTQFQEDVLWTMVRISLMRPIARIQLSEISYRRECVFLFAASFVFHSTNCMVISLSNLELESFFYPPCFGCGLPTEVECVHCRTRACSVCKLELVCVGCLKGIYVYTEGMDFVHDKVAEALKNSNTEMMDVVTKDTVVSLNVRQ